MKLYSKYHMTDGKQEICPQHIKATFSLHFYRFYTRRNDDLDIPLTSISFEKAF